MCMYVHVSAGAHRGQRRRMLLEVSLEALGPPDVSAGNSTQVLSTNSMCSRLLSHLPSSYLEVLVDI